ncbi:integrase [Mycolicibacterium mucogenicum DSM 44124]|nr:integrase [Mycolicibacterium mucogenicum DSM 44124]
MTSLTVIHPVVGYDVYLRCVSNSYIAERAVSDADGIGRYVIASDSYVLHAEGSAYLAALRSQGRSPYTERTYAGRVALFLSYCSDMQIDWQTIDFAELSQFLRWLVTTPPKGSARLRSPQTANQIMTTVCEFLRFGAAQGWVPLELIDRLASPRHVRYLPGAGDSGQAVYSVVQVKALRLAATAAETKSLSLEQVEQLIVATTNPRDRFLLALLAVTGMRIGEALGLRREDLHLLASSTVLGCAIAGPHVHIRRRLNDNGAIAKARAPRSIPVPTELVQLYADYQYERDEVSAAVDSDMVFVNIYRPPLGGGMRYGNAYALFERLSTKVGFTAHPHMLRHTAATEWMENGAARDTVQRLLGHVSPMSMERYLHPTDATKRRAVERVAAKWAMR